MHARFAARCLCTVCFNPLCPIHMLSMSIHVVAWQFILLPAGLVSDSPELSYFRTVLVVDAWAFVSTSKCEAGWYPSSLASVGIVSVIVSTDWAV